MLQVISSSEDHKLSIIVGFILKCSKMSGLLYPEDLFSPVLANWHYLTKRICLSRWTGQSSVSLCLSSLHVDVHLDKVFSQVLLLIAAISRFKAVKTNSGIKLHELFVD